MFNLQKSYEELEVLAERDPRAYRAHILRLALLGYAYIFAAGLMLLALFGISIGALFVWHLWYFIKLAFIPLIALFAVARSLYVKVEPPKGLELRQSDAPKLFEMIEEIRANTQCPRIDHVLLLPDYNCAATQHPKFGMLGIYETYVMIGLQMMDSLSPDQFKWVLAHELGHISNLDGRFSQWIYRVEQTWVQIIFNMANHESGVGKGLFGKFANWYFPLFDSHSLVLRRQHEYAADRFAAQLAGPRHGIEALLATDIRDSAVRDKFWDRLIKHAMQAEEPPADIFSRYRDAMKKPVSYDDALPALRLAVSKHNEMDSHPTLPERVKALGGKDDADSLLEMYETMPPLTVTAAEVVLGDRLPGLEGTLAGEWQTTTRDYWRQARARMQELEKELATYQTADLETWHRDDQLDYVRLLNDLDRNEEAIIALRRINRSDDGEFEYCLGKMLLDEHKDPTGAQHLYNSMQLSPWLTNHACASLYRFHKSHGDDTKAEDCETKAKEWGSEAEKAVAALPTISEKDELFIPPIGPRKLQKIRDLLYTATISDAWLVSRTVPAIIGAEQQFLIVKSSIKFAANDADLYRDLPRIAEAPELSGINLVAYTLAPGGFIRAATALPGAHIYQQA